MNEGANDTQQPSVLITGASSGIGRGTAEYFARKGWRVFATARNPDAATDLLAQAREKNWALTVPALDVTNDESVARAVDQALRATGGRLDVLINNAGYMLSGALEETTPDELRAQLETNVVGVQRVTRAVLPAMRARRAGAVVTIGSLSGRVALPMTGPYHTSKWALEGMIESLRYELLPFGIRVTLVEPGPFNTPFYSKEILARAAQRPDSPYAFLLEAYRRQLQRLPRADIEPLVEAIYCAATRPSPRLRWPTGPTAISAGHVRALVPDRLFEWALRIGFPLRAPPT